MVDAGGFDMRNDITAVGGAESVASSSGGTIREAVARLRTRIWARVVYWQVIVGWGIPLLAADLIAHVLVPPDRGDPFIDAMNGPWCCWSGSNLVAWCVVFWLTLAPYLLLLVGLAVRKFRQGRIMEGVALLTWCGDYASIGLVVCLGAR